MKANLKRIILSLLALALLVATAIPFSLAETEAVPDDTLPAAYAQIDSGATGDAVTRLQEKLIELGYLTGEASGTLDADTETALMAFQADNGLEPDGIATPELQALIFGDTEALAPAEAGEAEAPEAEEPAAAAYIGNKKTKKFHKADCSSVKDMKDSNKVELSTRDEAIDLGYQPCKRCNP